LTSEKVKAAAGARRGCPGNCYAYSGGGYEIVQALVEAKTKMRFQDAIKGLLFLPAAIPDSFFMQPPPADLAIRW